MKCLIVQPGAYGDIFICAPIAKHYFDLGYEVYWPARTKFKELISCLPYVQYLELNEDTLHSDWLRSDVMKVIPTFLNYDLVLNLADRGPHSTAQRQDENFEKCKYRLADVPFNKKNKLTWQRNEAKENLLFDLVVSGNKEYALVHTMDSLGGEAVLPEISLPIVKIFPVDGYNILDWFKIAVNAKKIYCIESSVHQFLDGIVDNITPDRFLLRRPVVEKGTRFTVSSNWKLDHIGYNSIIKG